MSELRVWLAASALLFAAFLAAAPARADIVLLEQSGLISGRQSAAYAVHAPSAGILTVKLTDLGWPDRLSSLSFAVTTTTSVLQTLVDASQRDVNISGAGTYYALVSGVGQGRFDMGLYSLSVSFRLSGTPAPIPLPGAAWLLVSALLGMGVALRKPALQPMARWLPCAAR